MPSQTICAFEPATGEELGAIPVQAGEDWGTGSDPSTPEPSTPESEVTASEVTLMAADFGDDPTVVTVHTDGAVRLFAARITRDGVHVSGRPQRGAGVRVI